MKIKKVRPKMCEACPYAKDVPSGVWSMAEYEKLREYDLPLPLQPPQPFACHAAINLFCHGWAACHDSLALKLAAFRGADVRIPAGETREIWPSGNEAADFGERDIDDPSEEAEEMIERLLNKHKRLSDNLKNK
jgi:hypothetical protein